MTTSRVGRKPVTIPSGVDIKIVGEEISIKGPKGLVTLPIHPYLDVVVEDGTIVVKYSETKKYSRTGKKLLKAAPGTARASINNAVHGVTQGFERKLNLVGVGYRAQSKGKILNLTIGYSHPVDFPVPEGITIETPSVTEIIIKGTSKHLVGHTAAKIMAVRPPEPYKGKGIIDPRKPIKRKETKKK
jgi:large subunit ribosomal protein L6